jgi:transposase
MEHYAAIDVSLEWSSVCVVDASGEIVREAKVPSEPEVAFFAAGGLCIARIGLEAGPLSQWLHAGLIAAGLPAILIETRHVKAALNAMIVKTDRNDARGMAQLMRMGWFRPVHVKTLQAQETRALLTARKLLLAKLHDVESSIRGILRGFGLRVGAISKGKFEARIRELVAGQAMLERLAEPLLRARAALGAEYRILHQELLATVREDEVCRRLMTVPGVGAVVYDLQIGHRPARAVHQVEGGRRPLRPDTEEVPVWRDRPHGPDQQSGRRHGPHGVVRGRQRDAEPHGTLLCPEGMGAAGRGPARHEEGQGGAGP